jgi:predicted DNA-binding WGR domain protein
MKNYFEYQDEKSSKFWEITIEGITLKTRYGKIGTTGQTTEKVFADEASAQKEYAKLVKEKTSKGYVEVFAVASETTIEEVLALIDSYNKVNAKIFSERSKIYNVLTKEPSTAAEVEALELLSNTKFPEELKVFYKTIGSLYNVENSEKYCFGIPNCATVVKLLQLEDSNYNKMKSIGLMDEFFNQCKYFFEEEEIEELKESQDMTTEDIEIINTKYKSIGIYKDAAYSYSSYFIYFDENGKFGEILYDQDTADDTLWKICTLKNNPPTQSLNTVLKNALVKITNTLVEFNT